MKKTTLLIIMCLALMAAKCQEPDTIICYSEEDMQMERQLRFDTIEYFESLIESMNVRNDSFDLSLESEGIVVNAKRTENDIWLSIIEGEKRSYLWLIDNEIQVRFALDAIQSQTWLPEERTIKY